jgi:hypothetical protein
MNHKIWKLTPSILLILGFTHRVTGAPLIAPATFEPCVSCATGFTLRVESPAGGQYFDFPSDKEGFWKTKSSKILLKPDPNPKIFRFGSKVVIRAWGTGAERLAVIDFGGPGGPVLKIDLRIEEAVSTDNNSKWAVLLEPGSRYGTPKHVGFFNLDAADQKFNLVFQRSISEEEEELDSQRNSVEEDPEEVGDLHWDPDGSKFLFLDSVNDDNYVMIVTLNNDGTWNMKKLRGPKESPLLFSDFKDVIWGTGNIEFKLSNGKSVLVNESGR